MPVATPRFEPQPLAGSPACFRPAKERTLIVVDPDWNDFRILLALAEGGSVAAAARLMSVDNSTISRRLAAIEAALGAQLLVRGGREFSWTAEGNLAVAAAERMKGPALEVKQAIRAAKHGVAGVVKISCATGLTSHLSWIPEKAKERYPELTVEISGRMAAVDLAKGEADIAIRMFKPTDSELIVRKGVSIGWLVVASKGYALERGLPASEAELPDHALVLYDAVLHGGEGPSWLEARRGKNPGVARFDGTDGATYAVASGMGIGIIPSTSMRNRPELVRVFPEPVASTIGWIVYHQTNRDAARVRRVVDLLLEFFDTHIAMFSGMPECNSAPDEAR